MTVVKDYLDKNPEQYKQLYKAECALHKKTKHQNKELVEAFAKLISDVRTYEKSFKMQFGDVLMTNRINAELKLQALTRKDNK